MLLHQPQYLFLQGIRRYLYLATPSIIARMIKSTLLIATITLACYSCQDSPPPYLMQTQLMPVAPLEPVSITTTMPVDQDCQQLQKNYVALDSSKRELERMVDFALIRLDSLVVYNELLEKKLVERNQEVGKLKQQIKTLQDKKNTHN